MPKYFISAVDPKTLEPVVMREIEAEDFADAFGQACLLGMEALRGSKPRITGITEHPEPADSFFMRAATRIAVEGVIADHTHQPVRESHPLESRRMEAIA